MAKSKLRIGDVIRLKEYHFECLGCIPVGEYVVEEARESGGWFIYATKLDCDGKYCTSGFWITFRQGVGYPSVLSDFDVIRRMTRIFV